MTNRNEIRKWQIDTGMTNAKIARESEFSGPYVSLVISGKRRNKKIIDLFVKHGCPKQFFKESGEKNKV